jgi:hypothetical protein
MSTAIMSISTLGAWRVRRGFVGRLGVLSVGIDGNRDGYSEGDGGRLWGVNCNAGGWMMDIGG